MGIRESINDFRVGLYNKQSAAFGAYGRLLAIPTVSGAFFVLTLALFGVCFSGLYNHYEKESSITELYTQKGARLEKEMKFHSETWGIGAQNFVMMQSDHQHGVASVGSLEASPR